MSDSLRHSLCESVDGSILMGHMQELARWVKLSGTPDELQSLRYFQAKLDEYGYRTNLIMHDAYISLPGKARVDVDNQALNDARNEAEEAGEAGERIDGIDPAIEKAKKPILGRVRSSIASKNYLSDGPRFERYLHLWRRCIACPRGRSARGRM